MKMKICLILVIIQKVQNFCNSVNKKIIGKMKDEFVGLKSKMYSLVTVDNEEIKTAKGVNKMLLETQDMKNILMFCLIKI